MKQEEDQCPPLVLLFDFPERPEFELPDRFVFVLPDDRLDDRWMPDRLPVDL